jgi:hypothetical protein
MKNFFAKTNNTPDALQDAIDNLYSELAGYNADTEEYNNITDQIVKMLELQNKLNTSKSWRPSPDAIVAAAGSILGILLILNYEQKDVMTSKALGLVGKLKN